MEAHINAVFSVERTLKARE